MTLQARIDDLIQRESLPDGFQGTVERFFTPLAAALARRQDTWGRPLVVGVNGAQGTGKSTLTAFVHLILSLSHDKRVAAFSLDDLYLTREEREALAERVHPLLAVRGVPGTHDIPLGQAVLDDLVCAGPEDFCAIPAFNKAIDDRIPRKQWPVFRGRADIVIIEGWCIGATAEGEGRLEKPLNALEKEKDSDGRWRRYVNTRLETDYAEFFDRLDLLIMIAAPGWEQVYQWRLLQEEKLRGKCVEQGLDGSALMSPRAVADFIQYYERVTRHCLAEMPARADVLLAMDRDHRIVSMSGPGIGPSVDTG